MNIKRSKKHNKFRNKFGMQTPQRLQEPAGVDPCNNASQEGNTKRITLLSVKSLGQLEMQFGIKLFP